jgi:hypothetical protein
MLPVLAKIGLLGPVQVSVFIIVIIAIVRLPHLIVFAGSYEGLEDALICPHGDC